VAVPEGAIQIYRAIGPRLGYSSAHRGDLGKQDLIHCPYGCLREEVAEQLPSHTMQISVMFDKDRMWRIE
jgi:hypothetical protein